MKWKLILLSSLCVLVLNAKDYNILDFGADSSGLSLSTIAIQSAIDKAVKKGGGTVVIPKGEFLTGTIQLASNIELHLDEGAILRGSTNPDHYYRLQRKKALIITENAEQVSITGMGEIDGQGADLALYLDSLFYVGQLDSNLYNIRLKRPKWSVRPQMIEFFNCSHVLVSGVTIKNGSSWVQRYELCNQLRIDSIKVESDTYWNNDGIDIVDCQNVVISNCDINASDDGICIKSHFANQGNGVVYCENIQVLNCKVRSSASAIKLGTNSYGGFKNIVIKNIQVYDTYRSAIAIQSVDGGVVEGIIVENVYAINTGNALFIRLGNRIRNRGEDAKAGSIKGIHIKDLTCEVPLEHPDYKYQIRGPELPFFHNVLPSSIVGIPYSKIEDVVLENVKILYPGGGNAAYANMSEYKASSVPEQIAHYPEFSMFGELPAWGLYCRHIRGITFNNVSLEIKEQDYRPAMYKEDVEVELPMVINVAGDQKAFFK